MSHTCCDNSCESLLSEVDIQTAWAREPYVDQLVFRVKPIIEYAKKANKPAWITIETSDRAPDSQSFRDKMGILGSVSADLLEELESQDSSPTGIIYHFYKNNYGKSE